MVMDMDVEDYVDINLNKHTGECQSGRRKQNIEQIQAAEDYADINLEG